MSITNEKLVGLVYRDKKTLEYVIHYPKTVGEQVEIEGRSNVTVQDHANSNEHLTIQNKSVLVNVGKPLGLCILDSHGFVDMKNMPPGMTYIKLEFLTVTEMLASSNIHSGSLCFVIDATDDPTVDKGWAIYQRTVDSDYTSLEKGWVKVTENESMDIEITWEALQKILPQSSPEEIDDMVSQMHTHPNIEVLNDLSDTGDNIHFNYKDQEVALRKDVAHWLFGDYYEDTQIYGGDIWLKGVPGQLWWYNQAIEDAGTSCYQKYASNTALMKGPIVRTNNTTTFRRMFYQDYNLEEIPQYNFENATDIGGFVQECAKLETVPYMNTIRCNIFDYTFSGCSKLKFGPELDMSKATSAISMYSGCPNLVRVYPFGDTKNLANMKNMFNGDSALEMIDSAINFSAIANASKVAGMFNDCIELSYLRIVPETLSVSLSLQGTNLSKESLLNVFDGLAEYTGDPSDAPTLNILDIEAASYLTSTQREIVTNKGWRLDYGIHTPVIYTVDSAIELADALSTVLEGDTLTITTAINTIGTPIATTGKNIILNLANSITADGSTSSGIIVTEGDLTITGTGQVVNNTAYSKNHGSGVINVSGTGSVTFNGGGVDAVITSDPVNKGQFGVTVYNDANVTVNDGNFRTGWYCISGNGSTTSENSVITINGGSFTSIADYAIYHPHPGKLIITGGSILGAAGAIAANNGTIEISGGTFGVLGNGNTGEWGDGTSGLSEATINLTARYGAVTCRISGGTFYSDNDDTPIIIIGTKNPVDIQISGGKFSSKLDDAWIADGYVCSNEKDSDGYYVVSAI